MSESGNDHDTTPGTAIGTVWPWQTLASLGITEHDLTTVRDLRDLRARVGTAAPVGSAGAADGCVEAFGLDSPQWNNVINWTLRTNVGVLEAALPSTALPAGPGCPAW
jgi:hypothetical protein